ncbi:hypothetical protein PPSIR1_03548 [Plesiocystis pacifica SIR-1]|uniref:Uncharacterized protein n=1 Tax=Plesiocystis pacifica SIR-1 TaxID=391625 RepID=A6G5G9_9BACT|nr:hypothetical protein [Plesiocystis pacifica]EDM78912.1 hypothetical protein PPSIR1_03548 [Plesiocystis pacifica SIR-1]
MSGASWRRTLGAFVAVAEALAASRDHPLSEGALVAALGARVEPARDRPPEGWPGARVEADQAAQYCLSSALWRALEGRDAFASAEAKASGELEPFTDAALPEALRFALARGLARAPSQRHASMAELARALAAPLRARRRWTGALGVGVGVLVLGALGGLGWRWASTPQGLEALGVGQGQAQVALGRALLEAEEEGSASAAARELDAGYRALVELRGPAHPSTLEAQARLAFARLLEGRFMDAETIAEAGGSACLDAGAEACPANLRLSFARYAAVAASELGRCRQASEDLELARDWARVALGPESLGYAQATLYRGWVCGWSTAGAVAFTSEAFELLERLAEEDEGLEGTTLAARLERGLARWRAGDREAGRGDMLAVREALVAGALDEDSRRARSLQIAAQAALALAEHETAPSDATRARLERFAARGEDFRYRTRPLLQMIEDALDPGRGRDSSVQN